MDDASTMGKKTRHPGHVFMVDEHRLRIERAMISDGVDFKIWKSCLGWIVAQEAAREMAEWEPDCAEVLGLRAYIVLSEDDIDWIWSRTDDYNRKVIDPMHNQRYRDLLGDIERGYYERLAKPSGKGGAIPV